MAESGGGVRVLTIVTDYEHFFETNVERKKYLLNERELERVLMTTDARDLPVAVVSVAGAYRSGKSFVLNFFLRYLSATPSARSDGTWLGKDGMELSGFSWRGGTDRDTTGILLWPEPFIITTSSGERVAVLLMDTQGTFDDDSSLRDCSTVFALSTLLSSIQMYNIKTNIGENDLQNLQLFTKYGKFLKDTTGKAFQELRFLIRDWTNKAQYNYGKSGGDSYVTHKLKILPTQQNELKVLREQIHSSFEKITGFLMPLPGMEIGEDSFKGRPEEIDPRFKEALKELATSIFSPDNLQVKLIGGQPVTCGDLLDYFKRYVTIFNSNDLPEPLTVLTAISEAGLLTAENKAREQFEQNIKRECELSMPKDYVKEVHRQQLDAAKETFRNKMLFADDSAIETKLEALVQELSQRLEDLEKSNHDKTNTVLKDGLAVYDTTIERLSNHRQLCVHVQDLQKEHEEALAAATLAFNEKRKILPPGIADPDRQKYLQDLQTKYDNLQITNEFNNVANGSEVMNQYLQFMVAQCNHDPKLTEAQFHNLHEEALAKALNEFERRRNKPNQYTEDIYKTGLQQNILREYELYKRINRSKNSMLLQLALTEYHHRSLSVSELRSLCLHPDDLKEVHAEAVTRVKAIFRPNHPPEEEFDLSDRDQNTLKELIDNHFETMIEINDEANKRAKEASFKVYKEKFDALTNYFTYFTESWSTAKKYHNEAFGVARDAFYQRRRSNKTHESDRYLEDLEKDCKHYYNPDNRIDLSEAVGRIAEDIGRIIIESHLPSQGSAAEVLARTIFPTQTGTAEALDNILNFGRR